MAVPGVKLAEVRLNLNRWNRVVTVVLLGLLPGSIFLTYLIEPFKVHRGILVFWSVIAFFASAFIHESLHGLAAMAKGVPRRDLHFEYSLSLYHCRPKRPMRLSAYRFFLLFPALVMLPPLVALWALSLHWLAASTMAINIAGSLVDVITWWMLRPYRADLTIVVDPYQPGCDLYGPAPGE